MPVYEEELFVKISILSILDYVDELIIIDNNSTDKSREIISNIASDKIKFSMVNTMDTLDVIMNKAIAEATHDWILRWDADFIAYGPGDEHQFSDLITLANEKETEGYVGIFLYSLDLYGDVRHTFKNKIFKKNGYLMKKECVKYLPSTQYAYEVKFAVDKKILYFNEPTTDMFYYVSMTNCKYTEKIFYNIFKSQYWSWLATQTKKIPFMEYFETVRQKQYTSSLKWVEHSICNEAVKHGYEVPKILDLDKHISDPMFLIRYAEIPYRDYPHYFINLNKAKKITSRKNSRSASINNFEITLIILVRNTEQYLSECLESVFTQTSTRWKIIIVNDGSNRGPLDIKQYVSDQYQEFLSQITVFNLPEWGGLIKAHKLAMMNVQTDIIGILDSDDMLEPEAVDSVLQIYNATKEEIFVYSNFWYCDYNMTKLRGGYCSPVTTTLLNDRCANHFRTFKVKHYYMTAGYDNDLLFGSEDQDILFQLEKFARPVFLPKFLYLYRSTNPTSISRMKTLSEFSMYISIIKNIIRRHDYFEPRLVIYSTRPEDIKEYIGCRSYSSKGDSKIVLNFAKYYFEIWSRDIFVCSINYEANKRFLKEHINDNNMLVDMRWSDNNTWVLHEITPNEDEINDVKLSQYTTFTPNQYFGGIYYIGGDEKYCQINFAYHKMSSFEEVVKHAKVNEYKKILIINKPVRQQMEFKKLFNDLIRNIPYDWNMLYLSKAFAKVDNVSNTKSNIIQTAVADDFVAIGFDNSVFEDIPIIGRILKLADKNIPETGNIKGTMNIKKLQKHIHRSYGYIHPLLIDNK